MRRQVEYAVAGLVILYIVFLTRPAPAVVSQVLSNPIGHLVVLGGIVYIGAFQSLLLALLLGVAYVASSPSREGADDTLAKKCKEGEEYDSKQKKCVPKKNGAPSESKKPEAPNSKTMPSPSKPITTTPPPTTTPSAPKPAPKSKSQADGVSDEDPAKKEKVMPASEFETFTSGGGITYGDY
jgi:hypothetical protein